MDLVVEVIAEHLRTNRKLIIPGFGAFMVKESGERIFSDLLRTDDGVLTSLLQSKGLSEMENAVVVDRFIFKVRHELEQYGYYRLGEVGTLRVEPTTKALRLYPPVQGEMPKQTPYVPKRVESRESRVESIQKEQREEQRQEQKHAPNDTNTTNDSNISDNHTAPTAPKRPIQPRKKFDFVMLVAVIILVVALLGIGYGWYVSNLGVANDDAAMDALRVTPELINE